MEVATIAASFAAIVGFFGSGRFLGLPNPPVALQSGPLKRTAQAVIPAEAGIQLVGIHLDSGFRRNDESFG